MQNSIQASLFDSDKSSFSLPLDYSPRRPRHFEIKRIVFARDSLATIERRRFIERIAALYPKAWIEESTDLPHNRIPPGMDDPLERHRAGKHTLVFGVHKSAVRKSEEDGNTCPNYWHFSPYSFYPYGCKYCYLAGTRGVYFSPLVKIFVNLPEIIDRIDQQARGLGKPTAFYLGKLQDALALEPLTGFMKVLVPFFAGHPYARMTLLTKCTEVDNLIGLNHKGHTICSWSLNPPEVHNLFETNVSHPNERLQALQRCAKGGYPVRAVLMPMIPMDGWEDIYACFIKRLLETVSLNRLTFGGICSYPDAKSLMETKLGLENSISGNMEPSTMRRADHRSRFAPEMHIKMYRHVINIVKQIRPDLPLALCLEEPEVMEAVGLAGSRGRCNCVL